MAKKTDNLKPFKKGQSGNPAGRAKGSKNITTIVRNVLGLAMFDVVCDESSMSDSERANVELFKEKVRQARDVIGEDLTVEQMLILRQVVKAIQNDDTQAFNAVMDRAYGKPAQFTEESSSGQTYLDFLKGLAKDEHGSD